MFEQVSTKGFWPNGARMAAKGHASNTPGDSGSMADEELIAIAKRFETGLLEWFDFVRQTGLSAYDEQGAGARAKKLREIWGNDLAIVKSMSPKTVRGATAKVSAAQAHVEFTGELDADASAFLAVTVREFDHLARHHFDDLPPQNRHQIAPRRSPWLFDLLGLRM